MNCSDEYLKEYQKERQIFDFINNTDGFFAIENYLRTNYLPLKERYLFYYLGRGEKLMDDILEIAAIWKSYLEREEEDLLGILDEINELYCDYSKWESEETFCMIMFEWYEKEFTLDESMYWSEKRDVGFYRDIFEITLNEWKLGYSNERKQHNEIKKELAYKIFIRRGYDHVQHKIDARKYAGNNPSWHQYMEDFHSDYSELDRIKDFEQSDYCPACQNSPCICSDPEKTSTIRDI